MARKRLPMILPRRNAPQLPISLVDDLEMAWRTRVGCKRSAPNRLNAPPVKKTKKFHLNHRGSHVPQSICSCADTNSELYPAASASENLCSEMADNFNLLGCQPRNRAAEEWKAYEEDEVESQVDRWVCRVCRRAAVSIVVLPCSHLCLCWDCDSWKEHRPVCWKPKEEVLYIRT